MKKFVVTRTSFSLVLAILGFANISYAQYDFTLSRYGPEVVVQGYHNYSILQIKLTEGEGQNAFVSFRGIPPKSDLDVFSARIHCCGFNDGVARLYRPGNAEVRISPSLNTPPGTYPITFVVESGGVTKELQFDLSITAAPLPLARRNPGTTLPPIPELSRWENQMVSVGDEHCDFDRFPQMSYGWEGDVWYYDGAWVFYQIGSYTNDTSKWNACGDGVLNVYRQWILDVDMQGWRIFPHGITAHYRRTQAPDSLTALKRLVSNTTYGNKGGHVHPSFIRETAYMIHSYRLNREEGQPPHYYHYESSPDIRERVAGLERAVAFSLGHLQHFLDRKNTRDWLDRFCPFMKGLAMHALIEYYQYRLQAENIADPRVPGAIAQIADLMWDVAWIENDESFYYEWYSGSEPSTSGAPDLNLLIAPAFAWLWQMTGDEKYRERGDQIFAGGVRRAYLGGGKHYSQNYRWSFDYVKWRSTLPAWIGVGNVRVLARGNTSATIAWTTDNPSIPAVEYGETSQYSHMAGPSGNPATQHQVTLTGLRPGTTYHFRVAAWDRSQSEYKRFVSEDFSFTTDTVSNPAPNPPTRLRIQS